MNICIPFSLADRLYAHKKRLSHSITVYTKMENAQRFMREELNRLGATKLVVSTNIPIRNNGLLYAEWMRRKIGDPEVAIYFKLR